MAPNFVSPGVYVIEKDISEYTPSINTSVVGVVGFASKGPTDKATLITSQNKLIDTFGKPSEALPGQALEGSLEILEETNSLYFIRATPDAAADASASVTFGTCPTVVVSANDFGLPAVNNGNALYLKVQVTDNSGVNKFATPKSFAIPTGTVPATGTQAEALRKILGGGLDSDEVGVVYDSTTQLSGNIIGFYAGSGASLSVSAYSDSAYAVGYAALAAASSLNNTVSGTAVSSLTVYGGSIDTTGTSSFTYEVESLYPGAGYNEGTTLAGDTSGNSIVMRSIGGFNTILDVNEDGTVKESFKVSLVGSGSFFEDVVNTGEVDLTSDIIKGNINFGKADITPTALTSFLTGLTSLCGGGVGGTSKTPTGVAWANAAGVSPIFVKALGLKTALAGGNNGLSVEADRTAALIGDGSVTPKTGMQALDEDALNVGIALVPGIYTESVQNALVTLAENTQDFIALLSPPEAIGTPQDAIDWTNGKSSSTAGSRTASLNSSYAAVYFPHVKVFSTFDSKDRFYSPDIFAARQMAYTDSVADSWFAPAGYQRGRLTKPSDVEVKLNQGDRDSLYSGGNVVNPIVSFPQQGITIFGQRTTQRDPTALDRVNVRRLMIYVRKVILAATRRYVFEPNDEFTWSQIEGALNPFLDDIQRRRGISEFRVVCDETTNTPVRVDRNELWCKVLIKPTKTAEILIFEVNLTNQSAQLGNL